MTPLETYSSLNQFSWLRHGFLQRLPGVNVSVSKQAAMMRLSPYYSKAVEELGFKRSQFWTAEQVHGPGIATIQPSNEMGKDIMGNQIPAVDGLMTQQQGIVLGILVADCCAIYIVDPVQKACALIHSGKSGTKANIVTHAIERMEKKFDTKPKDLIIQLSPCIRPPDYEIDFAKQIQKQCRDTGVLKKNIHDTNKSTSADLKHYYSYRMEKGKTGRHLALLGITNT